jgi:hypothetical protein
MSAIHRDHNQSVAELAAIGRSLALGDAISHCKRAASAAEAGRAGEINADRRGLLQDAQRRLLTVARELEALERTCGAGGW